MYQESPSSPRGAVLWHRRSGPSGEARVLPDGCMDLLLWNGRLLIAGPDTRPHRVAEGPDDRFTGLRFAPGMGPSVFGVPAHPLRDQRIPLADVWPEHLVRELAERAAGASNPGDVLQEVARARLARPPERRLPGPAPSPSDAAGLCRTVVRTLGHGGSVAEAARAVGLSERQLHRRSLDAFGYGPKTLARVLRMRRALRLAGAGIPLAEIAHRAGYADQPHLSREIRALTGTRASALLS